MATIATPVPASLPHRLAFPAIVLGSTALAFGPMLVRLADVAPVSSAFWRMSLAIVPLALLARFVGGPLPTGTLDRRVLWLAALAGFLFAVDVALGKKAQAPAAQARISELGWQAVGAQHRCPKCQENAQ